VKRSRSEQQLKGNLSATPRRPNVSSDISTTMRASSVFAIGPDQGDGRHPGACGDVWYDIRVGLLQPLMVDTARGDGQADLTAPVYDERSYRCCSYRFPVEVPARASSFRRDKLGFSRTGSYHDAVAVARIGAIARRCSPASSMPMLRHGAYDQSRSWKTSRKSIRPMKSFGLMKSFVA